MSRDTATEMLLMLLRGQPIADITSNAWRAIASLASKHRLAPLVFSRLKTLGIADQVPTDVLQGLRSQYLDTARRNARMYHVLAILLKRFQSEDIPCIPLKGVYLAEHVYGNIALRPMTDVDVLVKQGDLERVDRVMLDLCYEGPIEAATAPEDRETHGYIHSGSGLRIDVHWNLVNVSSIGVAVDIEPVWERSRKTLVAGIQVYKMSPEDLVLYLCLHTSIHIFRRFQLSGICDLAETLQRFGQALDWECIIQRGRQWKAQRCMYLNLRLAQDLLNAPIPDNSFAQTASEEDGSVFLSIAEDLLFGGEDDDGAGWSPSRHFGRFWVTKGAGTKLGLLWKSILPSRKEMAIMYPASPDSLWIFVYYPVRVWNLLWHYIAVVLQLRWGKGQARVHAEKLIRLETLRAWLLPAWSSRRVRPRHL